jgi:hypothetical protein
MYLVSSSAAFAQTPTWNWARTQDAGSTEFVRDIAVEASTGNIYVVGAYQSSTATVVPYGLPATNNGTVDAFLAKLDPSGNLLWSRSIGSNQEDGGAGVAVGPTGLVVITGYYGGPISAMSLTNTGTADAFVAAYDANGSYQWSHRVSGPGYDEGTGVVIADNKVVAYGSFLYNAAITGVSSATGLTNGRYYAYLNAYSLTGTPDWSLTGVSGNDVLSERIAADASNVYVVGSTVGNTMAWRNSLGNSLTSANTASSNALFCSAVSLSGTPAWLRMINNPGSDDAECNGVAVDCGAVFITGHTHNSSLFPGGITPTSPGSHDYWFLASLSLSTGSTNWVRTAASSSDHGVTGYDVSVGRGGQIHVAGSIRGNVTTDGGATIAGSSNEDILISRFNRDGTAVWYRREASSDDEWPLAITAAGGGNVLVGGSSENGLTLGSNTYPGTDGTDLFTASFTDPVWSSVSNNPARFKQPGPFCTNSAAVNLSSFVQAYAAAVASSTNVQNPQDALGAPNGTGAYFNTVSGWEVLDMGDTLYTGEAAALTWRSQTAGSQARMLVSSSLDGVTWSAATTYSTTSATYGATNHGLTANARFIRVQRNSSTSYTGFYLDAVHSFLGTSAGGTFSGPGVSGSTFDPAVAGAGTHTISYEVVSGQCTFTSSRSVVVGPPASGTLNGPANICPGSSATLTLSSTGTTGNTWERSTNGGALWTTFATNVNTVTGVVTQPIQVRVNLTNALCGNVTTNTITITPGDVTPPVLPTLVDPPPVVATSGCAANVTFNTPVATDDCGTCDPGSVSGYTRLGVFNGHAYYISNGTSNWTAANTAASATSGHLVTITSAPENAWLTTATSGSPVFIGLNDIAVEDQWVWVNGEPVSYTNWWSLYALDLSDEDGVALNDPSPGLWNDLVLTSSTLRRHILEFDCAVWQIAGPTSGQSFPVGSTTVTFRAQDKAGNYDVQSLNIVVQDNEDPNFTVCPSPQTLARNGSCQAVVPNLVALATATDNCPTGLVMSQFPAANTPISTNTLAYLVAKDASSNTDTCWVQLNLQDQTNPTLLSCPSNITVQAPLLQPDMVVNYVLPTAQDNCGIVWSGQTDGTGLTSGSSFLTGTTTPQVWRFADAAGRAVECAFTVTVLSNAAPQIDCPSNQTINAAMGQCNAPYTYAIPVVNDQQDVIDPAPVQVGGIPAPGPYPVGVHVQEWSATDVDGNTSTCSFNITVIDAQVPSIVCPNDTVVDANGATCLATVNYSVPVLADNCSSCGAQANIPQYTYIGTFNGHTYLRSWNSGSIGTAQAAVADVPGAHLLSITSTAEQNWIVGRIQSDLGWYAPFWMGFSDEAVEGTWQWSTGEPYLSTSTYWQSGQPDNVGEADHAYLCAGNTPRWDDTPAATELPWIIELDCLPPPALTLINGSPSGNTFPIGTHPITFQVTDQGGTSSTCSFNVVVKDSTAPMLTCPPDTTLYTTTGSCTANATALLPLLVANDACSNPTLIQQLSGPQLSLPVDTGWYSIAYSATDTALNQNTCSFALHVIDNVPPVILGCPLDTVRIYADSSCTAILPDLTTGMTVEENCSSTNTLVQSPAAWSTLVLGHTAATIQTTDGNGLIGSCLVNILLIDTIAPVLDCLIAADDTLYTTNASCEVLMPPVTPSVWDNCSTPNVVQHSPWPLPGDPLPVGNYSIKFKALDPSGNEGSCSFEFAVLDSVPPTITALPDTVIELGPTECIHPFTFPSITAHDGACGPATFVLGTITLGYTTATPAGPIDVTAQPTYDLAAGQHLVKEYWSDASGNLDSTDYQVTVEDTTDPVVICPDTVQVPSDALCHYFAPDLVALASISDNCPVDTVATYPLGAPLFASGFASVQVMDITGNTGTCAMWLDLIDTIPPTITCADTVTFLPTANCLATVSLTGPVAVSDNCSNTSWTVDANSGNWPVGDSTVTYTVTDGYLTATCQTVIRVQDNVPAQPIITMSGPTTICSGGSVTLTSSSATGNVWSTGATTQSITVNTAATYTVTVTNGNGCSATSAGTTVTVNPNPATPTISAGGSLAFCAGGSVTLNSSSATGNTWSTGATTQSITVNASGSYTVTVTNGNGCSATSAGTSVTVNPNPATPTISAGGPLTFCAGGSVTLTSSSATGNVWSTGATTQAITVSTSGTYSVTVTNGNGCSATSAGTTVTVNTNPSTPMISAGGPLTFCAAGSVTLTSSSATGNVWSTGATTQSITLSTAGTYTVTVTNGNGCNATSAGTTVSVNPTPAAPTISASGPLTFCAGGSVTLTSSSATGNVWTTGANTQSITVNASGTYTVTVTNGNGCSASSAGTTVTVNPNPTTPMISAGGPLTFCAGGSVTLTSSSNTGNVWSTGATTQSITASTAGTYTVTVTNGNGCSVTSAGTTVTVNPNPATPTISASGPLTFCDGGSVTLTSSSATGNVWTTGATTQSITVNASGTYTVTVTNGNGCSASSAGTTVTVNPNPTTPMFSAGGPLTFCAGGSVTLTSSSNTGNVWSTGATTQSITASTAGTYTVTVTNGNGCSATSTGTTVTVNPNPAAPTISASGPLTFCAGGSVTLTSSSATGNVWTTGANTQSITVNASGTYTVTVTNGNGCSASSAGTTVTVNPNPTTPMISAGGPLTFCAGGSVTLISSSNTGNVWSTGATTQSITASTAGTYTVTVTNGNGCSVTSAGTTVTVNPNPATPTISASGPLTFCDGGSVTLTSSSATGNVWTTGATTQSITVNASGTYTVTVTNGNGCSASSAGTTVTVNPNPTTPMFSAGGPLTFCAGGSVTLTSSSNTGNVWSTGATTQSITASTAGTYTVTVTNGNGCSATSTGTTVTVNPNPAAPTISAGGPLTFCAGGSVTLTSSSATGNTWSTGATTQNIAANASGTYTVTVTNGNGCSATSTGTTVTVNPNPAAPTISAGGPLTFCAGGSVTLTSSSATGNTWSTGATTQNIAANASGTYTVTVTNGNGCSATSTGTTVTVNPNPAAPTISAGGPLTFCAGGSVTLTSSSATGNVWSTGATTQSITANASGTYSVTVTDGNGCSATSAATNVTVNPNPATPTISAGSSTTFCAGGSVTLTSSSASGNVWSTGATTQSITVTNSGSYSVIVTSGGCSATSASTTVTVNPNPTTPTISADGSTIFCAGSSVTLTSSSATGNVWSTGATTQSITANASGTYSVTVTDSNGCSATSAAINVTVNPNPAAPTISAGGPLTFCAGGSVTLTSSSPMGNTWSTGSTSQSITVNAPGTYTVTVTNGNGCSATSPTVLVTSQDVTPPTIICPSNITLIADPGYCGKEVMFSASATDDCVATPTINYSHVPGSVFMIGAPTTVTASASDGVNPPSTCSFTVTVNAPVVDFEYPVTTICQNADPIAPSFVSHPGGTFSDANQEGTIDANGFFDPSSANVGPHTLGYVFNTGAGCVHHDWFLINVVAAPVINTGSYPPLCITDPAIALNATPAGGSWAGPGIIGTTFDPAAAGIGTHVITYTSSLGGCTATDSTTITVHPTPATPTITASGPTTFCAGNSVVLTCSAATSYLWSNGVTTQSITVSNSGTYSVTVTNGNGCSATSAGTTVTVNPNPATPTISAGGPLTFCAGGSVTLTSSSATGNLWSNGATTRDIIVSTSGAYSVTVTNGNGCSATSIPTSVNTTLAPSAGTPNPIYICSGTSVSLSYLLINEDLNGTWTDNDGNTVVGMVSPTTTTTYTYVVPGTAPCPAASQTVSITVIQHSDPGMNGALTLCSADGPSSLFDALGGTPAATGSWTGPSPVVAGMYDPNTMNPGAYLYTVSGQIPCPAASATVMVTENDNCFDCANIPFGTASIDACGTCSGGTTGVPPNSSCSDCNGIPNGTAFIDNCATCVGGNTGEVTACVADCNGDFGGTAFLDNCATCVGGNTGLTACVADCNGDFGGTAFLDNCATCVGGNTGLTACVADCNGDFGGTAFLDNCATCVGGNTGLTACVADCNGDFGGTAFIDNCATCVGGNTGEVACAVTVTATSAEQPSSTTAQHA